MVLLFIDGKAPPRFPHFDLSEQFRGGLDALAPGVVSSRESYRNPRTSCSETSSPLIPRDLLDLGWSDPISPDKMTRFVRSIENTLKL